MSNGPKTGESSNWDETFTDSDGNEYVKTGWSVYGGNEYHGKDGETYHTTSTDSFNHPTEIEKDYP